MIDLNALIDEMYPVSHKHPKDISIVQTNEIKNAYSLETLGTEDTEKVEELEDKLDQAEDLLKEVHEDLVSEVSLSIIYVLFISYLFICTSLDLKLEF